MQAFGLPVASVVAIVRAVDSMRAHRREQRVARLRHVAATTQAVPAEPEAWWECSGARPPWHDTQARSPDRSGAIWPAGSPECMAVAGEARHLSLALSALVAGRCDEPVVFAPADANAAIGQKMAETGASIAGAFECPLIVCGVRTMREGASASPARNVRA